MFTEKDLKQFEEKNISVEEINKQLENFNSGFPYVKLIAPATPGNGIHILNQKNTAVFNAVFDEKSDKYNITKMVPASGAASRMFKNLFSFFESDDQNPSKDVSEFIERIHDFAFFSSLKMVLAEDEYDIEQLLAEGEYKTIIRYLLTDIGLNYASLPKGLLKFHKYSDDSRTPLEEHMVEGMEYSRNENDIVHLHFTVSPEHKEGFIAKTKHLERKFKKLNGVKFECSFSEQKSSTDTIAVDIDNQPFRNADESILFRPGGHGALIENLNDLDNEIAFIKNIDNVVPDRLKGPTYTFKKALGGMLIKLMDNTHEVLRKIDHNSISIEEVVSYATEELNIQFSDDFNELDMKSKLEILKHKLNRPIRICGMVKNEGEPGGGPFWVESNGTASLQVVESSQINMDDPAQKSIVDQATHFNPVDLVCNLKDYQGNSFDLKKYIDPMTGFISIKSKDGRELKAQELPGLWNGAMANWITIFVEVPIETFNPVKTVNDLLRPQHQ